MNKTFGDLMAEYMNARDGARRFASWEALDKLVEKLVLQVVSQGENNRPINLN